LLIARTDFGTGTLQKPSSDRVGNTQQSWPSNYENYMMIVERKSKKHVKEFEFTSSGENACTQIAGGAGGSAGATLRGTPDRAGRRKGGRCHNHFEGESTPTGGTNAVPGAKISQAKALVKIFALSKPLRKRVSACRRVGVLSGVAVAGSEPAGFDDP
jgi:hypothetical protein